jgi:hypothetical protein
MRNREAAVRGGSPPCRLYGAGHVDLIISNQEAHSRSNSCARGASCHTLYSPVGASSWTSGGRVRRRSFRDSPLARPDTGFPHSAVACVRRAVARGNPILGGKSCSHDHRYRGGAGLFPLPRVALAVGGRIRRRALCRRGRRYVGVLLAERRADAVSIRCRRCSVLPGVSPSGTGKTDRAAVHPDTTRCGRPAAAKAPGQRRTPCHPERSPHAVRRAGKPRPLAHRTYRSSPGRSALTSGVSTWVCQVVDSTPWTMVVRVLASASDGPTSWDLRCEIREALIAFLAAKHPDALPRPADPQSSDNAAPQPSDHGSARRSSQDRTQRPDDARSEVPPPT